MNINATYKRAVRIISKPGEMRSFMAYVYDAETEESINNVKAAHLFLSVESENWVELTYYAMDEQGNILTGIDHQPIIRKTTLKSDRHEIDVTAWEVKQQTPSITAELTHEGVTYKGVLYPLTEDKP